MRALIPDLKRKIAVLLLMVSVTGLISCAAEKQQVRLVDDPDARRESVLPWNKQEKWEGENQQFAGATDRR